MTPIQINFLVYTVGVICGVVLAMIVRPYDFSQSEGDDDRKDGV